MEQTTYTLANAGAPKGAQQTTGPISVNGETIAPEAIGLEAQNHTAPKNKPGAAWNQAARAMAVRTLLLQVAKRQGITPSPLEVGPGRFETDEEALIRALLEHSINVSAPTDDQVLAEWQRDPDRGQGFTFPTQPRHFNWHRPSQDQTAPLIPFGYRVSPWMPRRMRSNPVAAGCLLIGCQMMRFARGSVVWPAQTTQPCRITAARAAR